VPTGVESYGQVYGLDEITLLRLQTGFGQIRAVNGWSDYRIPADAWNYVDQAERDRMLSFFTTALWVDRPDDDVWNYGDHGMTRETLLVWLYVASMCCESWIDNADRVALTEIPGWLHTDWGFPTAALTGVTYNAYFYETKGEISNPIGGYQGRIGEFAFSEVDLNEYSAGACFSAPYDTSWPSRYYGPIVYRASMRFPLQNIIHDYESGTEDLNENWEDIGEIVTSWPEYQDPNALPIVMINDNIEVLSGSARFQQFGLMSGSVVVADCTELGIGTTLCVKRGSDALFTGIVTGIVDNLNEGTFSIAFSDPVSAAGGVAAFTAGNAISALQEVIEGVGGTLETEMATSETVFFTGDTVDAWQFFRAVCYAVGGVLQYGRDGVYRLGEIVEGHVLTDDDVIGDDNPTVEERPQDYANRVAATIDASWQETVTEPETENFSAAGVSASITRLGEQITDESISYDDGDVDTVYTYDENGYLIEKTTTEEGSGIGAKKQQTSVVFSDISSEGNVYSVAETIKTWEYMEIWTYDGTYHDESRWVPISEITRNWHVDLDGMTSIEEIVQGRAPLYNEGPILDWDSLVYQKKWVGVVVSNPAAGPLEGYSAVRQYNYVNTGYEQGTGGSLIPKIGWTLATEGMGSFESKSYTPPNLEVYAAEDTREVHIIAKAEDPDAISALGAYEYETSAVALDTETGMQGFALGVLHEKSRIRRGSLSTPLSAALTLDTVLWRVLPWTIESLTVNLDRMSESVELSTVSNLARLAGAINREPVTWVEDVKNAINGRVAQYNNVARGRITSRVGYRRYAVQIEGRAAIVEAKALDDQPHNVGGSVILVQPTGKTQHWTLLTLSKEEQIALPGTVQSAITPPEDPAYGITEFSADIADPLPGETITLQWDYELPPGATFTKVQICDGNGTTVELTDVATKETEISYSEETGSFLPTIALLAIGYDGEQVPYSLDNGPIVLQSLAVTLDATPSSADNNDDIDFSFQVEPVDGFDDYEIRSVKFRKHGAAGLETLDAETTEWTRSYEVCSRHEAMVRVSYGKLGRGYSYQKEAVTDIVIAWSGSLDISPAANVQYSNDPILPYEDPGSIDSEYLEEDAPDDLACEHCSAECVMSFNMGFNINPNEFIYTSTPSTAAVSAGVDFWIAGAQGGCGNGLHVMFDLTSWNPADNPWDHDSFVWGAASGCDEVSLPAVHRRTRVTYGGCWLLDTSETVAEAKTVVIPGASTFSKTWAGSFSLVFSADTLRITSPIFPDGHIDLVGLPGIDDYEAPFRPTISACAVAKIHSRYSFPPPGPFNASCTATATGHWSRIAPVDVYEE